MRMAGTQEAKSIARDIVLDEAKRRGWELEILQEISEFWYVQQKESPGWYEELIAAAFPNPAYYVQVSYKIPGDDAVYNDTVILDTEPFPLDLIPASLAELKVAWKPGYRAPGYHQRRRNK
jgi:hypothetical protein